MSDQVFFCDKIPGGLRLTEQSCAKHYHLSSRNPNLKFCVGCQEGESNSLKHLDLQWKEHPGYFGANAPDWRDSLGYDVQIEKSPDLVTQENRKAVIRGIQGSPLDFDAVSSLDPGIHSLLLSVLYSSLRPGAGLVNKHWLYSKKPNYVFSCYNICALLNIDYVWLVKRIKELKNADAKAPACRDVCKPSFPRSSEIHEEVESCQ